MPALDLAVVDIPGGELELRDARTGTTRRVVLEPFSIGRSPVTVAEYAAVGGGDAVPDSRPHCPVTWFEAVAWCNDASAAAGLEPAYAVDGRRARWITTADGYRLPTEAEWEFACRGGTGSPTYGPLPEIAWTDEDGVDGPQPVGGKAANAFGLVDMLGNVWEWCWDHADTARYGDYRTLRGGGWADRPWSVRASVRRGSAPDAVIEDVGFRVARGAVRDSPGDAAQGWSAATDAERAALATPLPIGWTPLRD